GTWPYVCTIAILRPQTDVRLPARRHARSADPTWIDSCLSELLLGDLLVPEAVVGPGPSGRNLSPDDRSETATYHRRAHVDGNDEAADGGECYRHVYRDRQIAQPSQAPRNRFNEPQPKARKHKQ